MLEVMALCPQVTVSQNGALFSWGEMNTHLCGKQEVNSWFCFLAQLFLHPWTCLCLSPGVVWSLSRSEFSLMGCCSELE